MKLSKKQIRRMLPVTKAIGHEVWLVGYRRKEGSRKRGQEVTLRKPILLKEFKPSDVPSECKELRHHTES